MSRILVIVGSLRRESFNHALARALTRLPEAQGHTFAFADLAELPLYDQDDDANQAPPVVALKQAIAAADGVIFATPEYNRSISGVLKNAIDHASRPYGHNSWTGKPAAIFGVSRGKPGTAMAQQHLRNILAHLDMPVLGQPEAFVQWSEELITADGEVGEASAGFLGKWLAAFLSLVDRTTG